MVTAAENERTVIQVLADRFDVPVHRVEPGRVVVVPTPQASAAVRAFVHRRRPDAQPRPRVDRAMAGGRGAPEPGDGTGTRGAPGPGDGASCQRAPGRAGVAAGREAPGAGLGGAGDAAGNGSGGARAGDVVVMARPEHAELAERLLSDPATIEADLAALAATLSGRLAGVVARTGLTVPAPEAEVTLTDAADRRLPEWVAGHFTGPAWVVLSPDGRVLSTAVLKDYDERLREISVGTEEEARGRGLARAVVRAAARGVLAQGRSVLYLHDLGNHASAAVAAAAGLEELGRLISVVGERRSG